MEATIVPENQALGPVSLRGVTWRVALSFSVFSFWLVAYHELVQWGLDSFELFISLTILITKNNTKDEMKTLFKYIHYNL